MILSFIQTTVTLMFELIILFSLISCFHISLGSSRVGICRHLGNVFGHSCVEKMIKCYPPLLLIQSDFVTSVELLSLCFLLSLIETLISF